jgi:hypothetical protein
MYCCTDIGTNLKNINMIKISGGLVTSFSFFTYKKHTYNQLELFKKTFENKFDFGYRITFKKRNKRMYETVFTFKNSLGLETLKDVYDFFLTYFEINMYLEKVFGGKIYDGWECDFE